MIYAIFKWIFRLAIRVYFRKITIQWAKPLAADKPIVLVSNHPSAFMDAIIIAGLMGRDFHFMSRGESFDKPFKRWLFSLFHMHPIYRPEFTPELTHLNPERMNGFQSLLAEGRNLIIFPEGITRTEPRLQKIKSGAARVVLGAMADKDTEVDVQLIPIGLNYSNPHRFRSDLVLNVGEAIPLLDYVDLHQQEERKAVRQLTDRIATEIRGLTVEVEDKQLDDLVASVEQLCQEDLLTEEACKERGWSYLKTRQEISRAVHYFSRFRPEVLKRLQPWIVSYSDRLSGKQLDDQKLLQLGASSGGRLLSRLPALPFFLYAYINSWMMLKSSRFLAQKLTQRPDFYGSLLLAFGVLCTLIFGGLQIGLVYGLSGSIGLSLCYALTLPLANWVGLRYYQDFRLLWQWWQLCLGPAKDWRQVSGLLEEREMLLTELKRCWLIYSAKADHIGQGA